MQRNCSKIKGIAIFVLMFEDIRCWIKKQEEENFIIKKIQTQYLKLCHTTY